MAYDSQKLVNAILSGEGKNIEKRISDRRREEAEQRKAKAEQEKKDAIKKGVIGSVAGAIKTTKIATGVKPSTETSGNTGAGAKNTTSAKLNLENAKAPTAQMLLDGENAGTIAPRITKAMEQSKENPATALSWKLATVEENGEKKSLILRPLFGENKELLGYSTPAGALAVKNGKEYKSNIPEEAETLNRFKPYVDKVRNSMQTLTSSDGKITFGDITPDGFKAISEGRAADYTPFNDEEKKTLDAYKKHISAGGARTAPVTDYTPGAFAMTKTEYERHRRTNPDLPEFGSYEYFKNREEQLRPALEEIAADLDRGDDNARAWAENYGNDPNWSSHDPNMQKKGKELYEKFKYQDAILAEYREIDKQLRKFEKTGVHFTKDLDVDIESGAKEAKYAKERLEAYDAAASKFTNDEMIGGLYGELSDEKQARYDDVKLVAKQKNVEASKEKAYNHSEENKDNTYNDNPWGWVSGNYMLGRIGILSNEAGFASFDAGTSDIEASEVYRLLSERIQKHNTATFNNDTAAKEVVSMLAQYAPQGVDQAVATTVGKVVGTITGLGPSVGGATASAAYMYRQTAGAAFVRLLQESDLSVEDAKILSQNEALASSAVEFGLGVVLDSLWSGVGAAAEKPVTALGEKTLAALMKTGLSEKGAKTVMNVAKNAGKLVLDSSGEGLEEWIQEGMSITADKYAAKGTSASAFDIFLKSFDLSQYSEKELSRMNQSFLAGTVIGIGQAGARATTSLAINKAGSVAAKTVVKVVKAVDDTRLGKTLNQQAESGTPLAQYRAKQIITAAVEVAKNSIDPSVVKTAKAVESALADDKTPSARAVGSTVKRAILENSVSVGDVYNDTKYNSTITVTDRNDTHTTVKIDNGTKVGTKTVTNGQAAVLAVKDQYEKVDVPVAETVESPVAETPETPVVETAETVETPVAETPVVETPVAETTGPKTINLTQVGQFYEAYGDDAVELADKLELTLTTKTIDGETVPMAGFPLRYIAEYKKKLGDGYIFNRISETAATTETVTETAPVSNTENANEIRDGKVPFNTKEGLIEYVNAHIGDKVTFTGTYKDAPNYGGTQTRELESIGNNSLTLKGDDEQLYGVGLENLTFTDTGFVSKPRKGVVLTVDFVNVAEDATESVSSINSENVHDSEAKTTETAPVTNTDVDKGGKPAEDFTPGRTSAYTNDNEKIDLQFKVVSIDDLITSNDVDGSINTNYPQELQPRDRSRAASQNQIQRMAAELNPARLAGSTSVSDGAPIVGPDNVVESGNGRTLAIKLAYENGNATGYRDYIIANAEKFGIDPDAIPSKPVLVRERLTDVDRVAFTRKANESSVGSLSATEQAAVDAENLTTDILGLFIANDDGIINTPDNKNFISAVVSNVFKNEDLNNVVGTDGRLSARGLERITNAIFYKAYGDASLSARLSESLDNDMKNATNVLRNIAPNVVAIKNGIALGALYDFDFSSDIVGAIKLFETCRAQNMTVTEYASQATLFAKESPVVLAMAHIFETRNRGAKQATDFFNTLLGQVIEMGDPAQMSFGVTEVYQTKEEILNAAINEFNNTETTKPIKVPKSLFVSDGAERRNDDGVGAVEVPRNDSAGGKKSGTTSGVQSHSGPREKTGAAANDEQIRQETESPERPSEVGAGVDKDSTGTPLKTAPENATIKETETETASERSADNVHTGVLDGQNNDTDGGRKSESVQSPEEKGNADRESGDAGRRSADNDDVSVRESEKDKSSEEPVTGRADNDGVGERNDRAGDDRGNDDSDNSGAEAVSDTEPAAKPKNYSMTKDVAEYIDNKSPSKEDNLEAIRVLHELENTGKKPTKAQLEALAKYKGWGGLSSAFLSWQIKDLEAVMTEEEIKAARATVEDAYYTPTYVIDGIYKALSRLGFEGGNVLEPSMGIGNFFSKMPKKLMGASKLFGVEIDGVSGRIASFLHPDADITIDGFQNVAYKDGAFDLVVGNVPFGDVKYNYKGKKYPIHDFFFRKSLDKVADGGLMVFITSTGTLDKADYSLRAELASQADLVAAYRLPASVFNKSAGASVATDIIIMQKRAGGSSNGVSFKNLGNIDGIAVNEYFAAHPENILGELTLRTNQFGKPVSTVKATGDVSAMFAKAIQKLPKGLLSEVQTTGTVDVTDYTGATQRYTENGKNVEYVDSTTGEVKTLTGKKATVAKDYIKLRDTYNELIQASLNGESTSVIEGLRKDLKNEYAAFKKKHGFVTDSKKTLADDVDFVKVSGLEIYDTKTKSYIPSEVFEKDTLTRRKPTKADSALDALGISIGEVGKVNVKLIAQLTGKSEKDVLSELDDKIVLTPDGTYELNEVYLSGNIREKLRQVEGKKGFEKNAEMLKAAMPEDVKAKDITPQFGAPWISPKYVADFLRDTFKLHRTPTVNYDTTTGTWSIEQVWGDTTLMTKKYGTNYVDAMSLAEKAINMRNIVVKNRDGDTLVGETRAAQQKAEDIRNAFEEWCFKDSERRNDLVRIFNEKFNSHKGMDFSALAEHLTFAGLTDTFKLRDYQKRAVARTVFNGNTLLAHGVGTGKTAEMIAAAMELKRLGVVKKNLMVVPNHKTADFRNDILKMYPSAKVIVLSKGANAAARQKYFSQVASGDWDICIVPHSSFGLLDVSPETKTAFVQNQIDELEAVLYQAQEDKGKSFDGRFIRQLENQKKKLQAKLEAITEAAKKDKGIVFEELGVDSLFVDEAHNFKSLPFYTKMGRVAGVASTESTRAENMFMITDSINRTGGRVNFATATPIGNSMTEIYNMIRFLRPDILKEAGIGSFDAWAAMFGSIVNEAEIDPTGRKMRMKERFSKFKNVPQMVEQFRRMADILKTGDVIQELPEVERIDVINETNELQEEFLDVLDDMVAKIMAGGQKDAKLNMLTVTTAGQMAAIDLRMVHSFFNGKYSQEDLDVAGNRTSKAAERIYDEYKNSADIKGTQFVFCDHGVHDNPDARYNFPVYKDLINKLVAAGIPREEIAVAQDFEDKAELSGKVNTGEIRVLIGSTQVMGEGMNAQERAVALHHLTVPYRPLDIEQREGRIIRFGNINKNVRIYRYIQERSYDSYQWQMLERKANFINQALSNGNATELEEMSEFVLTAREAKAIASGNPLLLEKMDVEDKLGKLKHARSRFNSDKLDMQDRLAKLPARIATVRKEAGALKADADTVAKNASDDFKIKLYGKSFTERAAAAEHLEAVIAKVPKNGTFVKVGEYLGLDLMFSSSIQHGRKFALKGAGTHAIDAGDSALGNLTRITNLANKLADEAKKQETLAEVFESELKTLETEIKAEFPQAKELEELQAKLDEINAKIGADDKDMSTVIVDDSDDTDAFIAAPKKTTPAAGKKTDAQYDRSTSTGQKENMWETDPDADVDTASLESLSVLVKDIKDSFGVTVAAGKVTLRDALGIYKRRAEVIRTKIANQLPTIVHELGHHFNKKYKISEDKNIAQARTLVEDDFLARYKPDEVNGEIAAEFVRRYFKNPAEVKRICPDLTESFLASLSKEDLAAVNRIAPKVHAYMSAELSELYEASIIDSKQAKKLNRPDADVVAHEQYTKWIDKFHPIKVLTDFVEQATGSVATGAKNMYKLATNSLNAHSRANYVLEEGFVDLNGEEISGAKSLVEALKGVNLSDNKVRKSFDAYIKNKHALEVIDKGKQVYSNERLEDPDNIKKQIRAAEKEHPEFITAAKNLYDYQYNLLTHFAAKSGLMTQQQVDFLNAEYPCYVPFYRFIENKGGVFARRSLANQSSPIMKMKGSGRDTLSPLESIIQNTEKIINASIKHQTMQVLAQYADNVEGIGAFVERVPPDVAANVVDISALKEQFSDQLQQVVKTSEDFFAVTELLDKVFGDTVTSYTPVVNESKRIIAVQKGGERQYYQIHDEALFEAVAETPPGRLERALDLISAPLRKTNALITQFNPLFAVTNPIRDARTAYKLSDIDNPLEFAKAYATAIKEIFTDSETYKQYRAMGGGHSSYISAELGGIAKTLRELDAKDKGLARRAGVALLHPIHLLTSISDFTESIPRYMEFKNQLEKTGDLQEAIYAADDITTNFKRQGSGTRAKVTNAIFRFNNAALQGLDKTARTFVDASPERRIKVSAKWLLDAVLVSLVLAFLNRLNDEEGYENLSAYKKNNFYNISIGDGKFISLPKERENAVLNSLVERICDAIAGEDDAFYDFGGYLASQLLPPMVPSSRNALHEWFNSSILSGFTDIGYNKDFKGDPIEGTYEKYKPSNERYNEGTSKLAYALGQIKLAVDNDLSPKKIDHLLSSYLGFGATAINALFPMSDSRRDVTMGLRNRFISDSAYSTDVLNKVYDNRDLAERDFTYYGTADKAIEYERNAVVADYITEMNKAVKAMPEDKQRTGRAYLLKQLNAWNYDDTAAQNEMQNRLASDKVPKACLVTNLPPSEITWSTNSYKFSYQMTPQEYSAYVNDYLNGIEKYRAEQGKKNLTATEYTEALEEASTKVKSALNKNYTKKFKDKATKTEK